MPGDISQVLKAGFLKLNKKNKKTSEKALSG